MSSHLACALRKDQGKHAEDKRERGHEDGPKPEFRSFNRRIDNRSTLPPQLLSKFNNQNRVLGGQTDQHHQPDLAIDVVRETAQRLCQQSAQNGHGNSEQDDKRESEALILSG